MHAAVAVRPKRSRWLWPGVAAAAILAAIAGWWVWRTGAPAPSTGRIVRLTNYAGRQIDPALSPDGSQLAFVWGGEDREHPNLDMYVKLVGQPESLRLTTDAAAERSPTWSPDGKKIAFRRDDAILAISPLGGSEHKLGSGLPGTGQMSWSPDGRWIAVPADHAGVFAVPAGGGEMHLLTAKPATLERDMAAAFSPDGRRLAYWRCGASGVSCRIYLQALSAGGTPEGAPRRLFEKPFRTGGGLAWSRDARRIVFWGSPNQSFSGFLWEIVVDSAQSPHPINPAIAAMVGHVSIAGERLAYTLALNGSQIWQIEEGKSPGPFIRSAVFDHSAVFSPDGTHVVFSSSRSQDADHGNALFGARADGTGVVQLTGKEVIFNSTADWSPNGKWLVFPNQREDGNFDIVAMDSTGGALRKLTTASNYNTAARFSHDGSRVWFVSNRTGRDEVWSVPFTGGAETQITQEGRRSPRESVDGKTLYLLDSARNLYVRPVSGGPEKLLRSGVLGYAVVDNGLYLVQAEEKKPALTGVQDAVLHFADLQGGHDRTISTAPEYWTGAEKDLTVSPDRKRILYTALPGLSTVIQMIDGFR